jgi:hypothetical protein
MCKKEVSVGAAMKRNRTLSFEEDLLSSVLAIAADRRISANELVRIFFERIARSGVGLTGAMNGRLKILFDYSIGAISRSEARQRLGVSDSSLTTMPVASGLPPARATDADELETVDAASDVPLVRS